MVVDLLGLGGVAEGVACLDQQQPVRVVGIVGGGVAEGVADLLGLTKIAGLIVCAGVN